MSKLLEKPYENMIKKWLNDNHIYEAGTKSNLMKKPIKGWWFKVWGGGFQRAGIPDIICNINGHFVAIEVKGDDGHPSALQVKNIDHINESNGVGVFSYPKDFDDLKKILKELIDNER
jgi:hypothetical protein